MVKKVIKAEWTNKDSLDLQPTCNQLATTEGDIISRQEAIDAIMGEPTDAHYPSWYADRIKSLTSAEPKTGHWTEEHEHVYMGNGVKEWTNWYCSKCDAPNDKPTDFCPYCGCDMRGKQDE